MSKVTSKLQVTIPKAIAREFGIQPGSDVVFEPAGESIRLLPRGRETRVPLADMEWRLALFDQATARQAERDRKRRRGSSRPDRDRGWTREALYSRGNPR